jgi:diaminohydroxyphosphoribosylaminopyrimidine deaminase/5-amino-6-(5-phosphoribosylamino)uracil reductase
MTDAMTALPPPLSAIEPANFMAEALRLAALGCATTQPNPRVGCVIVQAGEIVGRGFHQRAGEPHAEVLALREAGARARDTDVYLTLEPCSHFGRTPPCADALIAAGVRRVIAAMQDPNPRVAGSGFARLRAAGIEVHCGLLGEQAAALNRGFISRMTRARPWVTLKLGASLDGRTAAASGESQWITGTAARADVHRLRAEAGAVLTSSATVLADDPQLSVRDYAGANGLEVRQPDRIVIDRHRRVPSTAKVWSNADNARRFRLVGHAVASSANIDDNGAQPLPLLLKPDGRADLSQVLSLLAQQEINELLIESGPTLAGAFLAEDRVDELVLYLAPSLLGDSARPLAHLPELFRLDQRIDWRITDLKMIGEDIRIVAAPRKH